MDNVIQGPWDILPDRVEEKKESSYENIVFGKFPELKHNNFTEPDNSPKIDQNLFETFDYSSFVPDERKPEYIKILQEIKGHTDGLITTTNKLIVGMNYGINSVISEDNIKLIFHFHEELLSLYDKIDEFIPEEHREEFRDDNLYHLVFYILNSFEEELQKRGVFISNEKS